jgi:hypothetical protein
MNEESQLFDLELSFNSKFKSKLMTLNSQMINIEQNYQSKLDDHFTVKERIKVLFIILCFNLFSNIILNIKGKNMFNCWREKRC